ncbi:MAG: Gfo/Idh/MocA family oxidoreductase, partial [Mycolicibacterium aromaticivorans]|nr:Gfo/Idh/MocA family oxidoreductase [Mycolicibacterium aromaticivorans]
VAGVVDPNESRGRHIAARFKKAAFFPDCEAAFGAGPYDLAIIASPPGLHADHACFALDQGSHVLCEKPMTVTQADAERMNTAAARSGKVLGVAFTRRFFANFADVARLVADGELGDDLRFTYRDGDTYGWPVATDAAFRREQAGGGVLLDKGIHMLDQLNWIFGDARVERSFDDSLAGGVEVNSLLELAFPRAKGTMHVSREYPLNTGLRIWGSSGQVALDGGDIRTYRRRHKSGWTQVPAVTDWPSDMAPTGGKRSRPGNYYACFDLQLIAMLRCIAYDEPFPVTGIQAARMQSTIDQAYASAQALDCPWLPEPEQQAARAMHWKAAGSE